MRSCEIDDLREQKDRPIEELQARLSRLEALFEGSFIEKRGQKP